MFKNVRSNYFLVQTAEVYPEPRQTSKVELLSSMLTHSFPMHPFSTPFLYLLFSGGRERMHWEQVGENVWQGSEIASRLSVA